MTSSAHRPHWRALALAGLLALTLALTWADGAMAATDAGPGAARDDDGGTPRTRILGRIDEKDRVTLTGNRHPRLKGAEDQGKADDAQVVNRMILSLMPDAAQQAALDAWLADSRNPASPHFGQWLSPKDYEARFGVSDQDIATVVAWLQQQGFTVDEVPAGRRSIVFSGAVRHIRSAFQTEMRHYKVGATRHLANASEPTLPEALSGVVSGVVSLHDFRSRPMQVNRRPAPTYTSGTGTHAMAASDFHTIYNVQPLLNQGINGAGRSIAILGRTNIVMGDIQQFRTTMGLPANLPQIILNGADPGRQTGDEGESDLDLEWAGAVAPAATIKFITSASTASTDGIDLSAQYAVSNNVADVISLSYGLCEADLGTAAATFYHGLWQQATAQGMTVFVSSGDSGAADCDAGDAVTATRGKAVNGLCTSPYATCVGGTQFNDTANPALYWSAANTGTLGSALGYIPEVVWNESGSTSGGSGLWASGGGASTIFTKPSWQTGLGVPNDGKRDVPDVSLTAAAHDGYLVYSSDNTTSTRNLYTFGGTSASAPSFAGLMALVNQQSGARQGHANPRFYQLAALQASGGPSYFHRVVGGNNSVPGTTGFAASTSTTTPTYNQATGLGSVDAHVLVTQWSGILPTTTTTVTASTATSAFGQSVSISVNVSGSGSATPGGTVQFKDGSADLGVPLALSGGSATLNVSSLSTGSHSLTAVYAGDALNGASVSAALPFTVTPAPTVVSVLSSKASSVVGEAVVFTAQLSGKSVGGSLLFMDGNTPLASVPIVSCPVSFSTSALVLGSHSITVVYAGDANNQPSTSAAITQVVGAAPVTTSTMLSASSSAITRGQAVTLTATVSGQAPGGSVQFMDGAVALGSPAALNNGVASLSTNALAVGSHSITASYAGDAANAPSVSGATVVSVSKAATTTSLTSSAPSVATGQSVTLSVAIAGQSPTGGVSFMEGSLVLGTATLNASGIASAVINGLSDGTHNVTAVYSGDANNAASSSPVLVQTVGGSANGGDSGDSDVPLPPWSYGLLGLILLSMMGRSQPRMKS
jgi:hypothetical protein